MIRLDRRTDRQLRTPSRLPIAIVGKAIAPLAAGETGTVLVSGCW